VPPRARSAPPREIVYCLTITALLGVFACGGGSAGEAIDRDVFISTYVELRMAAMDADTMRVGDEQRSEILSRNGVTEHDLVAFANVHAADMEFMRDIWNDIESRLDTSSDADDAN